MKNFVLHKRLVIEDPKFTFDTDGCFLNDYYTAGLTKLDLYDYFSGKCMDLYTYSGVVKSMRKCPWCGKMCEHLEDLVMHIGDEHKKSRYDLRLLKMQKELYTMLLDYCRNGNYDALSFLTHNSCTMCEQPLIKGREGKCAIPESARNKPRSMIYWGFNCKGYEPCATPAKVAIIYQRRPK